jgi:glycosyltransferase involved in cell wall biosynthesis
MKKIAIIGTAGIPANYGGFETLAAHLVNKLNSKLDISVYCSGKRYSRKDRQKTHNGARLIYLPFSANGLQSIVYDCVSILHALLYADVLLVLGVPGCFILPFVRLFTRKKIIVSIDGIEWKRNKWSKLARWYLWSAEWVAVKSAHANIADNESIQDYTAVRYGSLSNVIEYGADHTQNVKPSTQQHIQYPFLSSGYAIKVCRIEPENNVHMVLETFAALKRYPIVLIGNWDNSEYGISLKQKYSDIQNVHLLNPIYEQNEIDMLRSNATVYIHGHSAGGTNPSLVEAMSLALPVISYDVSYNRTTTENSALYFKNSNELTSIIQNNNKKQLASIGCKMKEIAERRYTWDVISEKYAYLISAVSERAHYSLKPEIANSLPLDLLIKQGISHLHSPAFFYEKRKS